MMVREETAPTTTCQQAISAVLRLTSASTTRPFLNLQLVDMCLRLSAQRREHLLQLLRQSLESDGVLQPTGAAGAA